MQKIYSGNPHLAWREQTQTRVAQSLDEARHSLENIDLADWMELKSGWRAFVLDQCQGLWQYKGQPVQANILKEWCYPGFRLQNIVFESMPGWKVGLNLFLPQEEGAYTPVIFPCGHSPKWKADHQLPPQIMAQHGFAAALFDAPMFGEKVNDNDHFIQGSQAAMVGFWSNLFFLIDAIRVADYLETRPDIDFSRGMGVTGVSGGGFTTQFMALVDERTRVIAPVCSVAPLGGHIIEGLYTGCPENFMFGQVSLGMDFDHLLCLASPLPCLVVAGNEDDLFRPEQVRKSFEQARSIYALENGGSTEKIGLYTENSPHAYTPNMAEQVARWMQRWLLNNSDPVDPGMIPELLTQADLDCGTGSATINMLDFTQEQASRLRSARNFLPTNTKICGILHLEASDPKPPQIESQPPATWGFPGLKHSLLHIEGDLSLPVVEAHFPGTPPGAVVCFGERQKEKLLYQNGGLYGLRQRVVSADLRGFGELEPLPTDYDLYSYCGIDRILSELVQMTGETVLGQQVRDALNILDWVCTDLADEPLIVYGHGETALPALFAGLLHPQVSFIVLECIPRQFRSVGNDRSPAVEALRLSSRSPSVL